MTKTLKTLKSTREVSTKIHILRNKKKSAKSRLTKAKNQLTELLESSTVKGTLPSKNAVRRAMNKIKTEIDVIEKIVASLKEVYALSEIEDADTTIKHWTMKWMK